MRKTFSLFIYTFLFSILAFAKPKDFLKNNPSVQPVELQCFINGYPNAIFKSEYDDKEKDWKITITSMEKTTELYWCGGKLLPKSEIPNQKAYRSNINYYPEKFIDPASLTKKQIRFYKISCSTKYRSIEPITAPYFFDAIYDTETKEQTEKHIVSMKLFEKKARVHKDMKPILEEIDNEVATLAKTDKEVSDFLKSLNYADSYLWRNIRDTKGKSFHSFGIALDVMPKKLDGKAIYWLWEKQKNPKGWVTLPLSKRWIPPQKVIDIFESHGFIWGGKWNVWDNMHFEYHPEVFELRKLKENR